MNSPNTETVKKNSYELMLVVPTGTDEAKKENQDKVKETLGKRGIEVTEEKELYTRKFYHPIDKKTEGIFYLYNLQAEPSTIVDSQKDFRLNQNILRFQFMRLSK